jgi:hypothetical protein
MFYMRETLFEGTEATKFLLLVDALSFDTLQYTRFEELVTVNCDERESSCQRNIK